MTKVRNDLINQETFDELKEMLGAKTSDVVHTYLKNAAKYISEIEDGIKQKDTEKVENAAHALKSSSRYFGLEKLGEICSKAENAARENTENEDVFCVLSDLSQEAAEQFVQIKEAFSELGYT